MPTTATTLTRELIEEALAAFERLTPEQKAHHRHAQRISFAYGNLALSSNYRDADSERLYLLRKEVEAAAGPCPCGACD